jgi:hypothetical protein
MRISSKLILFAILALLVPVAASARSAGCRIAIVVDGVERPEYSHGAAVYIEALRGRNYSVRLINPTPHRVAVALAVDGLNSIDARHTDGLSASKWVLAPYETAEIEGWQVSDSTARRFVFTGERGSYAAKLGQTANIGVIEAMFYRERRRRDSPMFQEKEESSSRAQPAPPSAGALSDTYAGTGMGGRTRHEVEEVHIDLDPHPIATARVRYEFRPQLVKLGILVDDRHPSPLERREKARGFEYCPQP